MFTQDSFSLEEVEIVKLSVLKNQKIFRKDSGLYFQTGHRVSLTPYWLVNDSKLVVAKIVILVAEKEIHP